MNEKTIKYWIESSDYDLITSEAMLETKRYLYVGFMAHQAVEKILKAFYVSLFAANPPHTHNLLLLADKTGITSELDSDQLDILSKLNPLNIEARYPKYKERLINYLTEDECNNLLYETKRLQKWVKEKLEIT